MGASQLQLWEQIALGAIIVAILFFAIPRMRAGMQRSAENDEPKDWMGFLIPMALVIVFVIVLIQLA